MTDVGCRSRLYALVSGAMRRGSWVGQKAFNLVGLEMKSKEAPYSAMISIDSPELSIDIVVGKIDHFKIALKDP